MRLSRCSAQTLNFLPARREREIERPTDRRMSLAAASLWMNDEVFDMQNAIQAEIPMGHPFRGLALNGGHCHTAQSAASSPRESTSARASARSASSRRLRVAAVAVRPVREPRPGPAPRRSRRSLQMHGVERHDDVPPPNLGR